MRLPVLSLCVLLLAPSLALAEDRVETVKFAAGASSATLKGAIKGYDGIDFRLDASAGQTMRVTFKAAKGSCFFLVRAPGSSENLFDGSMSGDAWNGTLGAGGTYSLIVYQMRATARRNETCRFSLSVGVSG